MRTRRTAGRHRKIYAYCGVRSVRYAPWTPPAPWISPNNFKSREGEAEAEAASHERSKASNDADVAFHCAKYFFEEPEFGHGARFIQTGNGAATEERKVLVGWERLWELWGEERKRRACLESAIRDRSREPIAYFNLTMVLNDLGRRAEVWCASRRQLDANPDFAGARNGISTCAEISRDIWCCDAPEYFGQRAEDAILDEFFGSNVMASLSMSVHRWYLSQHSYVFETQGLGMAFAFEASPRYFELCAKKPTRSRNVNAACLATEPGSGAVPIRRGGLFWRAIGCDRRGDTFARSARISEGFETIEVPSTTPIAYT